MRRIALSLPAVVVLVIASTSLGASPKVTVGDNFFKPEKVTIQKGGKVTWRWDGTTDNQHNIAIFKPGTEKVKRRSPVKVKGEFTYKFADTGTYRVICEIHPRKMKMKVIVKAALR